MVHLNLTSIVKSGFEQMHVTNGRKLKNRLKDQLQKRMEFYLTAPPVLPTEVTIHKRSMTKKLPHLSTIKTKSRDYQERSKNPSGLAIKTHRGEHLI